MQNIESIRLVSLLLLGFIFGLKHALEADHIAAVSTISSQTKNFKTSSLLGIFWGIGHTTTLLLAGFLVLILKINIPTKLALSFELCVGVTLIILGINVLIKIYKENTHFHLHNHKSEQHLHWHNHSSSELHQHIHKSFAVGTLHGLAGSATLMLLILTTTKSLIEGMLYIAIFGFGSIISMSALSMIISIPFLLSKKFTWLEISTKIISGSASILIGSLIIYEISYKNGLLF